MQQILVLCCCTLKSQCKITIKVEGHAQNCSSLTVTPTATSASTPPYCVANSPYCCAHCRHYCSMQIFEYIYIHLCVYIENIIYITYKHIHIYCLANHFSFMCVYTNTGFNNELNKMRMKYDIF